MIYTDSLSGRQFAFNITSSGTGGTTTFASNGLNKAGNVIRLGGSLTGATTLTMTTTTRLNFAGWPVQYSTDLSANFNPRSLIDKAYVTGITTNLDTKLLSVKTVGTNYNITSNDLGWIIEVTGTTNRTITIPSGLTTGFKVSINNLMTGNTVTIAAGNGANLNLTGTILATQYAGVSIYTRGNNIRGFGNLS